MATVTTNIQFQTNDNTWFSANASLVLLDGESAYHVDGRYKFGDGVTVLSALSFLGAGGGGGSQDLQSVTDLGSVTTNNVEANSFVKTGGVSTEFLKGDGTVDTNTYLTTESQTLQNVTDLGNTTTNDIQFDTGVGVLLDNTSRLREGTIDAGYGGAKGIAQICAVGYELKWESGTLYVMDGNGTHIRHSLYNFASVPGASEDISKGFLVGTRWSLDNGDVYVCTDNTITAAVWVLEASDFTSAEKTKLSGIASGAEVNVNADWNAVSGDAEILNKPTIPSIAGLELQANKQNSLTIDGTGVKYPTVDAINSAITNINTNAVDLITVKLALPINKGQAVYISSANGTNIIVSKASNTSESTSSKTLGLLETTGTTNDIVNVVTDGLLGGLNTSTATIGDPVWLGVTGALIFGLASKPYAPAHLVYIGVVSRVHATVGEIIVKVQNGFELKEIHDVDLITTAPSNNNVLTYESSTSLWKNKTVTTALGYTAENVANKDATGGYAGLTLFKINFKNALNTFTSFFTNSNTASRTYTFPDVTTTIVGKTGTAVASQVPYYSDANQLTTSNALTFVGSGLYVGSSNQFRLLGDTGSIGEMVAGVAVGANSTINFYEAVGTPGKGIIMAYYNGTAFKSAIEYFNVASGFTKLVLVKSGGNVGIGLGATAPTARLNLPAGTATAGSAPLKLTAGTNLTTPENGTFEFDGTNLYFTVGGVRKTVTLI